MDRAKSYSWLLTVIMGVALTTAVKDLATLVATPHGTDTPAIFPALTRFAIFLLLSIRWTLGTLWYLDRAYVSKNPPIPLGVNYFFDFFKAFINFLVFVPLALTITTPIVTASTPATATVSPLSGWLNGALLDGREVSTFIWILISLLAYDVALFAIKLILWLVTGRQGRIRVHIFWAALNLFALLLCMLAYLLWDFLHKSSEGAEQAIFFIIMFVSLIDLAGTVIEDSPLSPILSPV